MRFPPTRTAPHRSSWTTLYRTRAPSNSYYTRRMDTNPTRKLWDPSRGIKFAEANPVGSGSGSVVYPTIDFSRFSSSVAGAEVKLAGGPFRTDNLAEAVAKAGLPNGSNPPAAHDVPLPPPTPTEQGAELG